MVGLRRIYTSDELSKLGNAIIYFSEKLNPLSKKKLLKLVYLLDEFSVKTFGIPFFDLKYKVWQAGPVNVDLYSELSSGPELLHDYIKLSEDNTATECYVEPKRKFHDDEFSENEMKLMDMVVKTYGSYSAKKLVELCHRPNTLWYKIASENGLLEPFESNRLNTTDFVIDLAEYIKDNPAKLAVYKEHQEFLNFSRRFKK